MSDRQSKAFARVYEENLGRVYAFFGYRVGSRHDAEDLTQQTFERALEAWAAYDARRGTVTTWLMAIARNLLVDHFRRSTTRAAVQEAVESAEQPRSHHAEATPGRDALSPELESALASLSEPEREVIALRFGGSLTSAEIGQLTGLTQANVQQISARALRRLRERLDGSVPQPRAQKPATRTRPVRSRATIPRRPNADAA